MHKRRGGHCYEKETGEFVLSVSDNGKGITEEKIELQSLGLSESGTCYIIGAAIDITGLMPENCVLYDP